jgi:phosphate transport system protein
MSSQEPKHILSLFDRALKQLRADLFRMASLTELSFNNAARALAARDENLANRVIAEDEEVDELEKKIDADGIGILTRYAPLAHDFRRVFSTMKAATDLERITDQAVSIARRSKRLLQTLELPETRMLEPIFSAASAQLGDCIRSFTDEDTALAEGLKNRDRELDQMQHDFIDRITRRMEQDPANAQSYLDLVLIARFIERVGDHTVNIGEDSVYSSSARDVRHGREEA